jgi:L-asparaginase
MRSAIVCGALVSSLFSAVAAVGQSGPQPQASPQAQTQAAVPRVRLLATGGTISNRNGGRLTADELIASMPGLDRYVKPEAEQFANTASSALTLKQWLDLARRINALFSEEAELAGIVVTSGTDTLEETAYFLNLAVRSEKPVVVVGSMRNPSTLGYEGAANLLEGFRVAAEPASRGKGVLVVLNDEINAAREVTKTNTYRVETFRSGDLGLLGYVDADRVALYRAPLKRHTTRSEFDVRTLTTLPVVDILYSYVAPSPVLAAALVAADVRGIVVAGTGAGLMSTAERDAIKALATGPEARRPIVVRSNRTGNGRVIPQAETDALAMIPADNLSPQKARILLMLALTKTRDVAEIRRMFTEY